MDTKAEELALPTGETESEQVQNGNFWMRFPSTSESDVGRSLHYDTSTGTIGYGPVYGEMSFNGRPIHSGVPGWCGGSGSDLPFDPFNPPDPLE
jgi:hypothetical protein